MRTRQPEGHSPSPTFKAAYLSTEHCKENREELCLAILCTDE